MSFTLTQYGVTLKRITIDDIELIRKWRNDPKIQNRMAYRKSISSKEQLKWFEQVNNNLNYYFLIEYNKSPIGVINTKDVNMIDKYGEGGIFIWDDNHLNTPIPLFASLIIIDYIFNVIKFGDISFARIMHDNPHAIRYNKFLGYMPIPGQVKLKNQWYLLTKECFNKKAKNLRKAAKTYSKTNGDLTIKGERSDLNFSLINDSLNQKITFETFT